MDDELTLYPGLPGFIRPENKAVMPARILIIGSPTAHGKNRLIFDTIQRMQSEMDSVVVEFDIEGYKQRGIELNPYPAFFDEASNFARAMDYINAHPVQIEALPRPKNQPWYNRHSGRKWKR